MTTPAQDAPLVFPAVAFNPARLLVVCAAITAVAIAAAGLSGHLMVGVFFGVGLLLGLLNALLVRRSVASITAKEHPLKSSMAINSASRLAIITIIGLIIAFIFRPAGLGAVFGLALFQVVLVLSTALPVWKKLRTGNWAESGPEGTERGNTSDD
ncbi:ATP synthase subunit I [Mycobacterium sp. Aquia_216]|uniref:ATP synthase subunit I n=1 Tax=Mycobacterium sp. Aquia_216 TaxID=2991729 RepID=UPI00227A8B0E|nr:ATP synthase subunit I [Mycobacterium sp. Aquia_216]WAJ43924.1 ATP synthase subunit I [Mycobacterium sp. Aquia_216]